MPAANQDKKLIGNVTHYFGKIGVAAIELSDELRLGDTISFEGATTDFEQKVESIQIENNPVTEAKRGDAVGMKVKDKVRQGDRVYRIS
jgi:translation elongation factor EF-1alpha